jgi:LacI family transcriptional regulator
MTATVESGVTKRHATMRDVAKAAGVSPTTVSFVINGQTGVSIPEPTRRRVWAAVEQLGYRPNATARHLRTHRSQSLGFVTSGLGETHLTSDFILGAQEAAWLGERLLTVVTTDGDPRADEAALETLLARRVDGIIYATTSHRTVTLPASVRGVPTVLLNCVAPGYSLPSVTSDDVADGRVATEVLLRKGHRRIGLIDVVTEQGRRPGIERVDGYRQALAAVYAKFDASLVHDGDGSADDGYRATREMLKRQRPPTALICGTAGQAMGAYDALREARLSVPRDVAVLAFDGQGAIATSLRPSLSTIALPFDEMGRWAARCLTECLDQSEALSAVQHTIAGRYVERAST